MGINKNMVWHFKTGMNQIFFPVLNKGVQVLVTGTSSIILTISKMPSAPKEAFTSNQSSGL